MIGFDEAILAVRAVAPAPRSEIVSLTDAVGRTAAEAVVARSSLPTAPSAAMDGYACRAADAASASEGSPVRLRVVGAARAGGPFAGTVRSGEAVAISTGAVLPGGTDAIVVVEKTRLDGDEVELRALAERKHVRSVGEDLEAGVEVVTAGTRLGPWAVGLIAAAGHERVAVARRPRAVVVATGPELRPAGDELEPGEVPDSNGPLVAALLRAHGVEVRLAGGVADDVPELEAVMDAMLAEADAAAAAPDLIVTTGGASVGRHDVVRRVLLRDGEPIFDGIRVRPGRPALLGRWRSVPWLALPGTPHAVAVLGSQLLRAWAEAARGRGGSDEAGGDGLGRRRAVLEAPVRGVPGRTVLQLGQVGEDEDGRRRVAPLPRSKRSRMRDLAEANALIFVPEGRSLEAGEVVDVLPFGRACCVDVG